MKLLDLVDSAADLLIVIPERGKPVTALLDPIAEIRIIDDLRYISFVRKEETRKQWTGLYKEQVLQGGEGRRGRGDRGAAQNCLLVLYFCF
jgi:hypothetical protein